MPSLQTDQDKSLVRDRVLLVTGALLISALGVTLFWMADDRGGSYTQWVFFCLNVIGFGVVVGKKFAHCWKTPKFIAFFLIWAGLHAALSTMLAVSVPVLSWLPIFAVELFLGFLVAYLLLGSPPTTS